MDTFARALKAAVKILEDGVIPQAVKVTSGCGSCPYMSPSPLSNAMQAMIVELEQELRVVKPHWKN